MKLCIYRTGGAGAQGAAANGGMEPPKPSGPPSVIFFLLEKNRKKILDMKDLCTSLLDNASNYLDGCVNLKRMLL